MQRGQAGLVTEQLADRDALLSGRAELAASTGSPAHPDRAGAGPASLAAHTASRPLPTENTFTSVSADHAPPGVGPAAPQVRYDGTVDGDADGGPELTPFPEVARELLPHRGERRVAPAVDSRLLAHEPAFRRASHCAPAGGARDYPSE